MIFLLSFACFNFNNMLWQSWKAILVVCFFLLFSLQEVQDGIRKGILPFPVSPPCWDMFQDTLHRSCCTQPDLLPLKSAGAANQTLTKVTNLNKITQKCRTCSSNGWSNLSQILRFDLKRWTAFLVLFLLLRHFPKKGGKRRGVVKEKPYNPTTQNLDFEVTRPVSVWLPEEEPRTPCMLLSPKLVVSPESCQWRVPVSHRRESRLSGDENKEAKNKAPKSYTAPEKTFACLHLCWWNRKKTFAFHPDSDGTVLEVACVAADSLL